MKKSPSPSPVRPIGADQKHTKENKGSRFIIKALMARRLFVVEMIAIRLSFRF